MDYPTIRVRPISTRHLALFITLTALCTGVQLTPRPPSVEFTSLIAFLVGAVFGIPFGVGLGTLVMVVNGFISPWGVAGLLMPFQMIGMAIAGVGGGLYRRSRGGSYDKTSCIETAVLGAFLALVYEVILNSGYALVISNGQPTFPTLIGVFITGAFVSLVHVVSNTILFGAAFTPATNALQKLLGGEQIWKREFSPT